MSRKSAPPRTARATRTTRTVFAGVGTVTLLVGLSACNAGSFASMTPSLPAAAVEAKSVSVPTKDSKSSDESTPSASATAAPVKSAAPVLPVSDLVNGSLAKTVPVSDFSLALNYWSTLDMGSWTPSATKPLTVSATVQWPKPSKVQAYLSSFSYVVTDEKGNPVANGTDAATVQPGYTVSAPFTYNTVVSLPAVKADQRVLKVTLRYDLLVQTAPKVDSYYKQSVTDTLTLTLAKDTK